MEGIGAERSRNPDDVSIYRNEVLKSQGFALVPVTAFAGGGGSFFFCLFGLVCWFETRFHYVSEAGCNHVSAPELGLQTWCREVQF